MMSRNTYYQELENRPVLVNNLVRNKTKRVSTLKSFNRNVQRDVFDKNQQDDQVELDNKVIIVPEKENNKINCGDEKEEKVTDMPEKEDKKRGKTASKNDNISNELNPPQPIEVSNENAVQSNNEIGKFNKVVVVEDEKEEKVIDKTEKEVKKRGKTGSKNENEKIQISNKSKELKKSKLATSEVDEEYTVENSSNVRRSERLKKTQRVKYTE